jgi:hypothetical protein
MHCSKTITLNYSNFSRQCSYEANVSVTDRPDLTGGASDSIARVRPRKREVGTST